MRRGCTAAGGSAKSRRVTERLCRARRAMTESRSIPGSSVTTYTNQLIVTSGRTTGVRNQSKEASRSSYAAATAPRRIKISGSRVELRDPQGRRHLVHAVVESEALVLEPRAHRTAALVAHAPALRRQLRVVGHDHAAFARRDLLVGVEGEAPSLPEAPRRAASVRRADRLAGVVDQQEVAPWPPRSRPSPPDARRHPPP